MRSNDTNVPDSENPLQAILAQLDRLQVSVDEMHRSLSGRTKSHLTIEEVAAATGRAPYTVRTWIREGRLSAIRVDGTGPRGRLLVPREELQRLVAAGKGSEISGALSANPTSE